MTRTVLIAGDDSNIREFLQTIVKREGYDVIQADSGDQTLVVAQTLQIDAFILDVEMPRTGGISLCRSLRAMEQYRRTPILFLTGNGADDILDAALEAGGDDFITKPGSAAAIRVRLKLHFQLADSFHRLEWFRSLMKRYVSRRTLDVVDNASSSGPWPPPQEQDIAICFTDMRGFTAFAEEIEPSRLFSLVSTLLADQVQIIHEFGGYVDKFGGDGVMAIFEGPDMVLKSCLCALRIIENARLKDSGLTRQMIGFGIGIHVGRAVIGNIGSPDHCDYSAIGTSVNLAARLCGQAEAMSIVVSKAVRDAVREDPRLRFHSEREVPIRGIKGSVTLYTLGPP